MIPRYLGQANQCKDCTVMRQSLYKQHVTVRTCLLRIICCLSTMLCSALLVKLKGLKLIFRSLRSMRFSQKFKDTTKVLISHITHTHTYIYIYTYIHRFSLCLNLNSSVFLIIND